MESTYDTDADALYLMFAGGPIARTRTIGDGMMVDEDATGGLVGIEVLCPARDWPVRTILDTYEFTPLDRELLMSLYAGHAPRPVPTTHHTHGTAQLIEVE